MPQKPVDQTKRLNPYDLSAIADLRNRHSKAKFRPIVSKQPYEPERFLSAYDLSRRPGRKGSSTR